MLPSITSPFIANPNITEKLKYNMTYVYFIFNLILENSNNLIIRDEYGFTK